MSTQNSLSVSENLSLARINTELPDSLLGTFERRWLDDLKIDKNTIKRPDGTPMMDNITRFLRVYEIAHGQDMARSLHSLNMQNVLGSLRDGTHSLAYVLNSQGKDINLFFGVRQLTNQIHTEEYVEILSRSLRGNYPGIVLRSPNIGKHDVGQKPYHLVDYNEYEQNVLKRFTKSDYLAAITGIPSFRIENEQDVFTSQSVDRLLEALRGEKFLLLVLAEPIVDNQLVNILTRLRQYSQDVHGIVRTSASIARGENQATTQGTSDTQSLSLMSFISLGASKTHSQSTTVSEQTTESLQREILNKTAEFCEQLLDHHIKRIQSGRNMGFWNTGIYLACDDNNTFLRAQGVLRSLYSGEHTYFEPIRVLDVSNSPDARRSLASLRIPGLIHLQSYTDGKVLNQADHPLGMEYQSLGTPLTTQELSILVGFPNRNVQGIKLSETADFNLNPPVIEGVKLGGLMYRGEMLDTPVTISAQSLTRHTFVTGLTGSGKTNSCLALLKDAYQNKGLNFWVIDPAKTEYRLLLQASDNPEATRLGKELLVFTLGLEKGIPGAEQAAPFRINPFEFEPNFPLLSHIDFLKSIINAAFPMYASMPYLLEEAIFAVYRDKGWDVTSSTNKYLGKVALEKTDYIPFLPRLSDLVAKIDGIVRAQGYDERLKNDLTAALKARLGSLLRGGKGRMLDCQRSIPMSVLLNHPVIFELRRMSDDDEKSFLMSLLFVRLYEAVQSNPPDGKLRHVTLFEEAHRLLRNIPNSISGETANPRGKAVEMFTDMMAEMRAHGEGFIIVDQVPGKLVPDVVKGSNLKIVHRLLAQDDREAVGNAMGLKPHQTNFLPNLGIGEAVIHSEELRDACLTKVDPVEDDLTSQLPGESPEERFKVLDALVNRRFLKIKKEGKNHLCYHKLPGCQGCDNPCDYTPENNGWDEIDIAVSQSKKLISCIVAGNDKIIVAKLLESIQSEIKSRLVIRYHRDPASGEFYCACAHLSARISTWLLRLHPQALPGLIKLQPLLTNVFYLENDSMHDALRIMLITEIMKIPRREKPGCRSCRLACHFGHIFQADGDGAITALKRQIEKKKKLGEKITYRAGGNLSKAVKVRLKLDINPELLDDAAYCWVVNSTDDPVIYAHFWGKK